MGETGRPAISAVTAVLGPLYAVNIWAAESDSSRGDPDMLTYMYPGTCRSTSHAMGW
jgi:hypothetical protein